MKRTLRVILALIVALTLVLSVACAPSAPAPAASTDTAQADTAAPAEDVQKDTDSENKTPTDAGDRTEIRVGIVNPGTGPIASFGEGTPWTEEHAIESVNKDGGIFIKELNKKLPVKLIIVDSESDPTKASELASKLVLEDKVDILVTRHTPDTILPVSAVAERYEVPCVSMDGPVDAWLPGGPYKWAFHAFWEIPNVFDTFEKMWKKVGLDKCNVGVMLPNDADGMAWSKVVLERVPADGFTLVDPGTYPAGTKDFTSMINLFKEKNVDVVMGVNIPPDFATFWRQCKQMNFKPKFITVAKAYLFKPDALAMGADAANGLAAEVWWSPWHPFKSSITGESSQQLCDAWTAATQREWTPPIGYKYASMEVTIDALKRAQSLDKTAIRDAIAATDLDTIVGHIKYTPEQYCYTPVIGGQWVKDGEDSLKLEIISNEMCPEIPITAEPLYPLP